MKRLAVLSQDLYSNPRYSKCIEYLEASNYIVHWDEYEVDKSEEPQYEDIIYISDNLDELNNPSNSILLSNKLHPKWLTARTLLDAVIFETSGYNIYGPSAWKRIKLSIHTTHRYEGHGLGVLSNGVFDCLHIGHLSLMKNFKDLCEEHAFYRSHIAVNTDESVFKFKGRYPVQGQLQRALQMFCLIEEFHSGGFGTVSLFDETNPSTVINMLRPKYHLTSSEYKYKETPEDEVKKNLGITTIYYPRTFYSSTFLKNRIHHDLSED